jgi:hypothetical protein
MVYGLWYSNSYKERTFSPDSNSITLITHLFSSYKLAHKQTLVRTIDLPKKNYFNQRDLTTYNKYIKSPSKIHDDCEFPNIWNKYLEWLT